MKTPLRLLSVVALGAVFGSLWQPRSAWARSPAVVVELFTAQGCAPCKQADHLVAELAKQPGIIALTWSVDYWDYLGWKDTFAQPAFANRQRAYARRLGPRDVYTPQVVVGGASQVSGDDATGVDALIRAAQRVRRRQPKVRFLGTGRVRIGSGARPRGSGSHWSADVWLVRYDPREKDVEVTAGDNKGATVAQRDVVREVLRLGAWSGHPITLKAPAPPEGGLASAVIVQTTRGGPIIAAAAQAKAG